jgi:hypothetical protein
VTQAIGYQRLTFVTTEMTSHRITRAAERENTTYGEVIRRAIEAGLSRSEAGKGIEGDME